MGVTIEKQGKSLSFEEQITQLKETSTEGLVAFKKLNHESIAQYIQSSPDSQQQRSSHEEINEELL